MSWSPDMGTDVFSSLSIIANSTPLSRYGVKPNDTLVQIVITHFLDLRRWSLQLWTLSE